VFAVELSVMTTGFRMMFFGVAGMTVGAMRMMRRLLVIARFVMLGGFAMMLRSVLVMFGGFMMVLDACVIAHVCSPGLVSPNEVAIARLSDTMLTRQRQDCCAERVCDISVDCTITASSLPFSQFGGRGVISRE
jgi:hypothetical protein